MTVTASRHQQKRRILRNTAANATVQAATMLSTLILLPLLVKAFGVGVYGTLALSTSVTGWAVLLDLGIGPALTRMVADRTARGDARGVVRAAVTASLMYATLGLFVAGGMLLLARFSGLAFSISRDQASLLSTLLTIGALAALWQWPTTAARDVLAGLQRYDLIARVALGVVLADIVGTIYVLTTGRGPVTLALIRVGAMVAASLAYLVLARRALPEQSAMAPPSRADASEVLHSGSSVFALQIAGVMSRQQADKLILGVFVGAAAVGLYDIAAKLNALVATLSGLTVSAALPVAAEIHASRDVASLRSMFLRGTKIVATFMAPIITVLIVLAVPFVAVWFGPGFAQAGVIAQILLASQLLLPLYQLGDQVLIGTNRFSAWVPGGLALAVLNVTLSIVLVQSYGAIGVALGTLVACLLEFPWYARVFSREVELPFTVWMAKTAWPLYPLLAVPAAIAALAVGAGIASLAGLAATALVALGVYWLIAARVAYSPVERADLRSLLRRAPTGEAA